MLFAWITDPNAWLALGTLTLLEIVLGIDNIIFPSLVVAKAHSTTESRPPSGVGGSDGYASGAAGFNRLGHTPDKTRCSIFGRRFPPVI